MNSPYKIRGLFKISCLISFFSVQNNLLNLCVRVRYPERLLNVCYKNKTVEKNKECILTTK